MMISCLPTMKTPFFCVTEPPPADHPEWESISCSLRILTRVYLEHNHAHKLPYLIVNSENNLIPKKLTLSL